MKNSFEGVLGHSEVKKADDLQGLLSGPTVKNLLGRKINSVKDLSDSDLNSMKKLAEDLEQQLLGASEALKDTSKYLVSGLKKVIEEREKYASYLDKPDSDYLIDDRMLIIQRDLRDLKQAIEKGQ